jgi:hypothetical protein
LIGGCDNGSEADKPSKDDPSGTKGNAGHKRVRGSALAFVRLNAIPADRREVIEKIMEKRARRLLINWNDAHHDLKQLIEDKEHHETEIENSNGWSYITFFPKAVAADAILYDVNRLQALALDNSYHLPYEVITQHNKVVVTAYPEGDAPMNPLLGLYRLMFSYVNRFIDPQRHPSHGFYGKLGGIYDRPEKGRVLAIYAANDEALLDIYESIEKLISETPLKGVRFDLRFSNGLSALPRMLHGFDDPAYRRSGAVHYRITNPELFAVLLDQARRDYKCYPFEDA